MPALKDVSSLQLAVGGLRIIGGSNYPFETGKRAAQHGLQD